MAGLLGRRRLQALLHRCSCSSNGNRPSKILERPLILCSARARRMSSAIDNESQRAAAVRQQLEAAAREDRLDLFQAARILFSTPSNPKKFGLDFHIWQFFVALLPPFAVYLTAQYARYEMRRMEKEREQAEKLKLQAALAEDLGAESGDEDSKQPSIPISQGESSTIQQGHKDVSKAKNKDEPVVILPEKDLLAMKARLDAMEVKVKLLECFRPGTTFRIPLEAETNVGRELTKENMEQSALPATDPKDAKEPQRKMVEAEM